MLFGAAKWWLCCAQRRIKLCKQHRWWRVLPSWNYSAGVGLRGARGRVWQGLWIVVAVESLSGGVSAQCEGQIIPFVLKDWESGALHLLRTSSWACTVPIVWRYVLMWLQPLSTVWSPPAAFAFNINLSSSAWLRTQFWCRHHPPCLLQLLSKYREAEAWP